MLGLPLDEALRLWRESGGEEPGVAWTCDPRSGRTEGTARVVRVRPGEWTAARFLDAEPRDRED